MRRRSRVRTEGLYPLEPFARAGSTVPELERQLAREQRRCRRLVVSNFVYVLLACLSWAVTIGLVFGLEVPT